MGSIQVNGSNGNHDDQEHRLLIGTFNTPELFVLTFNASTNSFVLQSTCPALGNHSWLSLDESHSTLLATCWTDKPSIASYAVHTSQPSLKPIQLINTQTIKNRSGYVVVRGNRVYTAGGVSGEVIALDQSTKRLTGVLQTVNYVTGAVQFTEQGASLKSKSIENGRHEKNNVEPHANGNGKTSDEENVLDFGGLRHGAHSADISPDGTLLYVADIGRNCIWVNKIDVQTGLLLDEDAQLIPSPRSNDGPRHVWPHPNGQYVYVLQEHSCMVDVFRVVNKAAGQSGQEQRLLEWVQGVRIIPQDQDEKLFWADEVRLCPSSNTSLPLEPELLVASTRGLKSDTKGYVALFNLTPDGLIVVKKGNDQRNAWLDIWQTPTSGGWANAVEPCARPLHATKRSLIDQNTLNDGQYMALTDSEQGLVMILAVERESSGPRTDTDTRRIVEVARLSLGKAPDGRLRGAATAVWL